MAISNSVILSMLANGASEADVLAYVQANGAQAKAKPAKPKKLQAKAELLPPSKKAKDASRAKTRYSTEYGTLYLSEELPKGSTITIQF